MAKQISNYPLGAYSTLVADKTPIRIGHMNEIKSNIASAYNAADNLDTRMATIEDTHLGQGISLTDANICQGGAPISGGSYAFNLPANAFDMQTGGMPWLSVQKGAGVSGVAYIGYLFKTNTRISSIRYRCYGLYNVSSLHVQTTVNSGNTWTTIKTATVTANSSNAYIIITLDEPVIVGGFRLLANSATNNNLYWGMYVLQAFGATTAEREAEEDKTHNLATYTKAGLMDFPDKLKLDSIDPNLYALKKSQFTKNVGFSGSVNWLKTVNPVYNISISTASTESSDLRNYKIINVLNLTGHTEAYGDYVTNSHFWDEDTGRMTNIFINIGGITGTSLSFVPESEAASLLDLNTAIVSYTATSNDATILAAAHSYSTVGKFVYSGTMLLQTLDN